MKINTKLTKTELDDFLYIINNPEITLNMNLEDVRDHAKIVALYKKFIALVKLDNDKKEGV